MLLGLGTDDWGLTTGTDDWGLTTGDGRSPSDAAERIALSARQFTRTAKRG